MTTPTQAQIEAAARALYMRTDNDVDWERLANNFKMAFCLDAKAALTAAAEVGEQLTKAERTEVGTVLRAIVDERLATIERCAQVAESFNDGSATVRAIVDEIRALKEVTK